MSAAPAPWRGSARLQRASWIGTAVFFVASSVAVVWGSVALLSAVVAVLLFVAGVGAFFVGFATAVGRSRAETIYLPGLFFLAGSAPTSVQRSMLGSLLTQVVIAFVAAGLRPVLAFGILAPIFGLGMITVWAATHGTFPARAGQNANAGPGSSTLGDENEDPTATSEDG